MTSESLEKMLENSYLVCLTRRPTEQERKYFLELWAEDQSKDKAQMVYDLHWVLFNAPEFSWNH